MNQRITIVGIMGIALVLALGPSDRAFGHVVNPDTTARFEQDHASVSLSCPSGFTWDTNTNSIFSGGSAASSMGAGCRATFTFTGTDVDVIGYKDEGSGFANVFLDGKLKATIDTFASPAMSQAVLFSIKGLTASSHTITIEVAGDRNPSSFGTWVTVDRFDVFNTSVTRIEQNDAAVSLSCPSGFTWDTQTNPIFSGGSAASSMGAGCRATLNFTGTGVHWIGYRDEGSGIADVFLDGVLEATVDTFSSQPVSQAVVFSITGLSSATHTLAIEVTGTSNPSSSGIWVSVDAFDLEDGGTVAPPPSDTTAPSVAITSPAAGTTVSGTISVTADASDDVGVAGVEFFARRWDDPSRDCPGETVLGVDTTAPYAVTWDTSTVPDCQYLLVAKASDTSGNTAESPGVAVTVHNDTTPPTVAITSPTSGATVSGTITVTAEASDNVQVAWVQLSVDGVIVSAQDTTAPYEFSWDTTTVADGSHTLTAEAQDRTGNSTVSPPVTVTVSNAAPPPTDTTPPTVALTSPADGATVSGTISVTADASDNVGVVGVQFFVDGAAIGGEDTTAPYAASWDTTTVADGSHTLTAVARDTSDNTTTSSPVTVTVSNAAPPPGEPTRIEETDASITYTGMWVSRGAEIAEFSGGTARSSAEIGATATLSFTGTGVSWLGWRCEICGIARVTLDGAVSEVDTFAPTRDATSVVVFSASGLADGSHTLAIEILEKLNPSSGNRHIVVDAFDITDGGGTASTTTTSSAGRLEGVVWTSLVNVTDSGFGLTKTGGCNGCEDAGAVSVQTLTSTGGYVEFTAAETTTMRVVGLSHGNLDTSRTDIDFGIQLWPGGGVDVRENGLYRAETTFTSGDVFRIAVHSGVVTYAKNGTVFYTSLLAPTLFPLGVDTALFSVGATVKDPVIYREP